MFNSILILILKRCVHLDKLHGTGNFGTEKERIQAENAAFSVRHKSTRFPQTDTIRAGKMINVRHSFHIDARKLF